MAANYRLLLAGGVKRLSDGAEIPFADGNMDYEDYKAWLAQGNAADAAPAEDWLPEVMARLQALRDRLMEAVTQMQADYIAAADSPNAIVCRDIKTQLRGLDKEPALTGAASRAAFRTKLRARLNEIAGTAPADVQAAIKAAAAAA